MRSFPCIIIGKASFFCLTFVLIVIDCKKVLYKSLYRLWRRSQAVRQWSAKPLFSGSSPLAASSRRSYGAMAGRPAYIKVTAGRPSLY